MPVSDLLFVAEPGWHYYQISPTQPYWTHLFVAGGCPRQVQPKAPAKPPSWCRVVLGPSLHLIELDHHIPGMQDTCLCLAASCWHAPREGYQAAGNTLLLIPGYRGGLCVGGGVTCPRPWCIRSLIATASSFLTMAVTSGDLIRNSVSVGISSFPSTRGSSRVLASVVQHTSSNLSREYSSLALRSLVGEKVSQ